MIRQADLQAVIGRKPAKDAGTQAVKKTIRQTGWQIGRRTDRQSDGQAAAAIAVTHRSM